MLCFVVAAIKRFLLTLQKIGTFASVCTFLYITLKFTIKSAKN